MGIWLALLSAAIFGLVTVTDKRLISVNMPNISSFYFIIVITLYVHTGLAIIVFGIPDQLPLTHLLLAGIAGLFWGASLWTMFIGYRFEEASRASAVIHTFPVFVALLAVPFLGEILSIAQCLAILIVVVGAFSISLRSSAGNLFTINKAFPILIAASILTALAHITGKYSLEKIEVEFVYAVRNFFMATFLAMFIRPKDTVTVIRALKNPQTLALVIVGETILAPIGIFLNVAASSIGAISIVSTVTASRPFFVFLYGSILSIGPFRLLDESIDIRTLATKAISISLIIGGIALLSFG
jgi:drug/metabolite transporter (DMT)-like permease